MTWRDKLEIGLKDDAPFRRDNLPPSQVDGPEVAAGDGRSPVVAAAVVRSRKHPQPKRSSTPGASVSRARRPVARKKGASS